MLANPSIYPERALFNFLGLGVSKALVLTEFLHCNIQFTKKKILIILHHAWFSSIQDGVVTLRGGKHVNMLMLYEIK